MLTEGRVYYSKTEGLDPFLQGYMLIPPSLLISFNARQGNNER